MVRPLQGYETRLGPAGASAVLCLCLRVGVSVPALRELVFTDVIGPNALRATMCGQQEEEYSGVTDAMLADVDCTTDINKKVCE